MDVFRRTFGAKPRLSAMKLAAEPDAPYWLKRGYATQEAYGVARRAAAILVSQSFADNLNCNVMADKAWDKAVGQAKVEGKSKEDSIRLGDEAADAARIAWTRPRPT